jgi:hypothetical protein
MKKSSPQKKPSRPVCIEGPLDVGKWTESVQAGFHAIGLASTVHYHNAIDPLSRISNRVHDFFKRRGLPGIFVTWKQMSSHRLQALVRRHKPKILICLQSTIEANEAEVLRKTSPEIQIIYWWGTQVDQEDQIARLLELASFVDVLALTYKGDCERLRARGASDVVHLPFACCPYTHQVQVTPKIRKKWGRDVVLVGPHDEYLEELVCKTSEAIQQPVDVWGSGWANNQWVRFNGQVQPPKTHYIYAGSTIVLNLHGATGTSHNGLNAAFYEIAAAGGFQVTEEQPILAEQPLNRYLATFNNARELGKLTRYYLTEAGKREAMRAKLQEHVLAKETYGHRLFTLLKSMGFS